LRTSRYVGAESYDRTGDRSIVCCFILCSGQPGIRQDFVELVGTEQAILFALDEPERFHYLLDGITRNKVAFVHEMMRDAKFDLIEHGGGAASSTVISPTMFEEFCVAYDKRVIDTLHECGFHVVYHTCDGMMLFWKRFPLMVAMSAKP
jgi:uroporphyrinogen-III decarboxylase